MLTKAQQERIGSAVAEGFVSALKSVSADGGTALKFGDAAPATSAELAISKDPEELVGRYFQVILASGAKSKGAAMDLYNEHYKGDTKLEKALSASDFSAGGAMVGVETAADMIELLRPATVVRAAGPQIRRMNQGTLEITKHTAGSTGSYVGENQTGGSSQPTTGMLTLSRKKLKVEIPFSNDLLRFSQQDSAAFVRQDAIDGLAVREDAAFIRDDGVAFTPRGMRFWVPAANVTDVSGDTDNLATISGRLRDLEVLLRAADVRMLRPHWFFSSRTWGRLTEIRTGSAADQAYAFRDEMRTGTLNGIPWSVSNQIPENLGGGGDESEIYLVDMADAIIGDAMEINLDVFPGGAYHDGTAVRSGISRDQTVLRAILQHDFGMRHDASVAILSGVTYGV